ncbi:MAG: hypothetical protein V1922_00775 [bacterium]
MILIIIILTLFIISSPVKAQEFIPYQNNPIVMSEPSHRGVVQPFVLREQNAYSLWYADDSSTGYRILRMQSANGIDWYDKKDTLVTTRQNASDPSVLFENNIYTLYFASSNFGYISLWESKSQDGATFTPGTEKEILKSQVPWEGTNLSCPSVIKDNNIYYLFYAGSGVSNWGIGLATSLDGQSWQKCPNNPFIAPGASGHVIKYNNVFYLFFQSPNGLEVQQTNLLNGCNTVWTNRHVINSPLRDPSPIQVGSDLWLYGTLPTQTGLHIGLAANTTILPPSYPVVIIPGTFASWNKEAILHNTTVPFDSWKLHPAVAEYDAIQKTLENIGRTKNTDYFVFPYDWRKPVVETVHNLDAFLIKNVWLNKPYQPVQIVGHSLGGVVSRIYAEQNSSRPIKQIITVGAPLMGTTQAYKPLAMGEIDRDNSLMWMAEKLILMLNKSGLQSDKDTISQKFPVLFDILPTFPFLRNESGIEITSLLTNGLMSQYPINLSPVIPQLYIGASGRLTLDGYVLSLRTPIDIMLGLSIDGHPYSSWTEDGDGIVLAKSSLNQISPVPIQNHGEIIYAKESIKTILSKLNIQVQDGDIPVGKGTAIFPAILAFIQSPATIQITHNGATTQENEGMIYLQNTETGEYSLKVTGQFSGEYTVSIWLIGSNNDQWYQFKKQTTVGGIDNYSISFDNISGGVVSELIPTNTPIPTITPTIKPTLAPTMRPTIGPTAKPIHKPEPTKKPSPTKKPTPTPKPHKPTNDEDKREKEYIKLIKLLLDKLLKYWRGVRH